MEMDSLQAPLISNRDPDDHDEVFDDGIVEHGAPAAVGAGKASPGMFMWLLTCSAGISGLLFGCMSLFYVWCFQTSYASTRDLHATRYKSGNGCTNLAFPTVQTTRASYQPPSSR